MGCTRNPDSTEETKEQLKPLFITVLIIVGVFALFLQHVLGSLRRRSSAKLLHAIVLGVYTLSYSLVSYTLGLMQNSCYYFDEFPVWAVCLLMLLGGTDSLTTCVLNDIDSWKSFYVKHLMKGVLVVYIVVYFGHKSEYQALLWAILFVNVFQSYARIMSMRMASKSHLLGKIVKPIDDYMKREHQLPPVADDQTPHPMQGYRYIVAGEHSQKNSTEANYTKITTVDQIWRCKGSLLSSERGQQFKDVCLSMALSKMLNRRFAGFKLPEAGLQKTRDFVFRGLLAGDKPYEPYEQVEPAERAKRAERAFRVTEIELAFVHDLYYTRYPYLYHKGRYSALALPVAMVILCSCLTYKLFKKSKHDHDSLSLSTTLYLMAVVTFLEVFQLYLHMASGWCKVALIRSYVTKPLLQRGCFSQMIFGILLSFKSFRPWQAKLGQYSLLQDFDGTRHCSKFLHYATLFLVDKTKKGRKRVKLVKLSKQVKQAIVDSLVESNGHLMNGERSLRKNGVHEQFSWACHASDGTVTHTILVWHIATAICKHQLAKGDKQLLELPEEDKSAVDTASSLSQYCAYLVAFAPNLLPDHSSHSSSILDESIKETRKLLKGAKKMESKCEKLMCNSAADAAMVVVRGARLAKQLTDDIQERRLRWKVLADFWAEMMLYVTPCDDCQAREHLAAMAIGGEFITHLWALLTHAGVLKRDSAESLDAV